MYCLNQFPWRQARMAIQNLDRGVGSLRRVKPMAETVGQQECLFLRRGLKTPSVATHLFAGFRSLYDANVVESRVSPRVQGTDTGEYRRTAAMPRVNIAVVAEPRDRSESRPTRSGGTVAVARGEFDVLHTRPFVERQH